MVGCFGCLGYFFNEIAITLIVLSSRLIKVSQTPGLGTQNNAQPVPLWCRVSGTVRRLWCRILCLGSPRGRAGLLRGLACCFGVKLPCPAAGQLNHSDQQPGTALRCPSAWKPRRAKQVCLKTICTVSGRCVSHVCCWRGVGTAKPSRSARRRRALGAAASPGRACPAASCPVPLVLCPWHCLLLLQGKCHFLQSDKLMRSAGRES